MSWEVLPHPYDVRVREQGQWADAVGWAVNSETGELEVTMGRRILSPGDRRTQADRRRFGPNDWLSEEPIPGWPVKQG